MAKHGQTCATEATADFFSLVTTWHVQILSSLASFLYDLCHSPDPVPQTLGILSPDPSHVWGYKTTKKNPVPLPCLSTSPSDLDNMPESGVAPMGVSQERSLNSLEKGDEVICMPVSGLAAPQSLTKSL